MQDAGSFFTTSGSKPCTAANRFGVDYADVAARLGPPPAPITDFHTHVNGTDASVIWRDVARLFGIERVVTMVRLCEAPAVRKVLGDMVEFIAFPDFRAPDRAKAMTEGFIEDIRRFHGDHGATMIKLWNAPRLREFFPGDAGRDMVEFDGAWRVRHVEEAQRLGMSVMVHIADPDTWFATKYADAAVYGRKIDHYRGLEVMLERFRDTTWYAAHMGGYAEDLDFLDGLMARHPNLRLDTSATKWVVRELSKHPRERVLRFFSRWRGRILFGSDIVTTDEHLSPKQGAPAHPMGDLADSPASAFTLYASRYAALRLMFETAYEGESPIADPDLMMVDPAAHGPMSAPRLRGFSMPADLLRVLYHDAAKV